MGPPLLTLGPVIPAQPTDMLSVCVGVSQPLTCSEHGCWAWGPSVVPGSEGDTKSHMRTVGLEVQSGGPSL